MKPHQVLEKSHRPNSAKHSNSKKLYVQTLELTKEPEQPSNQKPVRKVQLGKTGTVKPPAPRSGSPDNQFEQFMQQKIQNNSKLRNLYEGDNSASRIASKPFQLQKQKSTQENQSVMSAQTEFTLSSQNSKKPYRNFYKDYKHIDTTVPNKRNVHQFEKAGKSEEKPSVDDTLANPSFASTEKSYEVKTETVPDIDSVSVSSASSQRKVIDQQNFKQFVQMKKQCTEQRQEPVPQPAQQPIAFRGWTVNEPAPLPSRLQTRQYQSVMENLEQIVETSSSKRKQYLKELEGYIKMMKGGQLEKKEQKPSSVEDQADLEHQIKRLAKKLKQTEQDHFKKQASMTVSSLHSIAEDSIENLSNLTAQELRDRSMFITGILKNRSRLQQRLNKQEEEDVDLSNSQLSEAAQTLQARLKKHQTKLATDSDVKDNTMSQEQKGRLEIILQDGIKYDPNPFDMLKEASQKLKWNDIHAKLKQHNKNVEEFDSIEMYDDLLPKDKFLRQEAVDRIIRTKSAEVNKNLTELAMRQDGEDRYKIQDLVSKLQREGLTTQEMFKRYPELQDEQLLRLKRYKELEHQEQFQLIKDIRQVAKELIAQFNPKQLIMELGQLKLDMDQALQAGKQLQDDIHEDPRYQLAETLQEKKLQLQVLAIEHQAINQRAERLFELESLIQNMTLHPEPSDQALPQIVQLDSQTEKTLQQYDEEITRKLIREKAIELSDEPEGFFEQFRENI